MKKSLMFLIAVLLAGGMATAQITSGGDKAPKTGTEAVTADAHADPRGSEEYKPAGKVGRNSHKRGKERTDALRKKGGKKIKITPDPSCSGSRCIQQSTQREEPRRGTKLKKGKKGRTKPDLTAPI